MALAQSTDTVPTLAQQVGAILRATRLARGLSLRALAAEVGVKNPTLVDLENGYANPTLARIERMAAAYGVELTISTAPPRPRR